MRQAKVIHDIEKKHIEDIYQREKKMTKSFHRQVEKLII